MTPRCPIHSVALEPQQTRFGVRHQCPVTGCTVAQRGGPTSTPADDATRRLRQDAHAAFDGVWKSGLISRGEAYSLLAKHMNVHRSRAHIGMFDAKQCETVISFSATLRARIAAKSRVDLAQSLKATVRGRRRHDKKGKRR